MSQLEFQFTEFPRVPRRDDLQGLAARESAVEGDYKVATAARKPPLDLVPLKALTGTSRVFQYGAKKYAPGNFIKANEEDAPVARYIGAVLRHMKACQNPDGTYSWSGFMSAMDDESGLPEIDHMIAGLLMLRCILIKGGMAEDPDEAVNP